MIMMIVYGLGMDTSSENVGTLLGASILMGIIGNALGYTCGLAFDNDDSARAMLICIMLTYVLTMGVFSNLNTNIFTKYA
jgi:hypothetical protein